MQFGLLGKKLGHSYSPQIHAMLGSVPYGLFEKQPEELEAFLKTGDFQGINVTIPYKTAVIPYCAALSSIAQTLGAVNTIVRQPDGSLLGHNTDYGGFLSMVSHSGLSLAGKKVLVLGTGGASLPVRAALQKLGADAVVISRTGENNYGNLSRHRDAAAIVNATPVGMYPETGKSALELDDFPRLEGVLDLIYNPARTKLLMDAEERGLITENGLWMLVAQAKESAQWFLNREIPDHWIQTIYQKLRRDMENIILIGMPGCGKSTVGQLLAQKLGRQFVDADRELEAHAGMTIPELIADQGESVFRDWEEQTLSQLGMQSGLVIATGGGCVTRRANYRNLHQNGVIYWLQRELSALPTDGRPLSRDIEAMYQVRKPLYEAFADRTIQNSGSPDSAVTEILKWEETT